MTPADRHLWRRFWAIASPYWRQDERLRAWGLLTLLVVLLLGQTRFAVMLKKGKDARQTEAFQRGYVENMSKGFQEDIDIWMEKRFVENPVLCEGDGPFHKLRKWYQQFYV